MIGSDNPLSAPAADSENPGFVQVRGAREHNLKNVGIDIPRDAIVVFTGVSRSGKSCLAFGTLYAEAQRRYLDSVAPYARRLIHQVGVPAVDSIEGLPPAVALQQHRGTPTTRSSVGSVTTISNSLRMLYSHAGSYPRKQSLLHAAGSDWVIDIGPGAGDEGGRLVAQGKPRELSTVSQSRTAPYLARFLG